MIRTCSSPISLKAEVLALIETNIRPRTAKGSDAQRADFDRRVSWLNEQPENFWSGMIKGSTILVDDATALNALRLAPRA